MSGAAELERVYSAIEEAAGLADVACARGRVMPILTAYEDALAGAGIGFGLLSGERSAGELDYTMTVSPSVDDPYAVALSNGLVAKTDHPVGALLSDLRKRLSISDHLIDCGVVGGFKKTLAHFPRNMQKVSELADIPSMPSAVGENASFFDRHGLDKVAMIAIDYGRKTMNLYFQRPPKPLERETVLSMVGECGLPSPSQQALEFAQKAFRVNVTLSWDSPEIARIALAQFPARSLDPSVLSDHLEPGFERLRIGAPRTYPGEHINLLGLKWSASGEAVEFVSYYQLSPAQQMMMAAHGEEK
ncbi:aromatic prenyltransferase [Phytohabitans rumicis]|uniref:Prenyltransferase n=1 Tax=Phytohabitans rumicis TaxID=1076125 RepID=A0A6V8KQ71_9ACTN|nr:aromatic prenyltransferase [Phytohabitans rumicis]GFJ87333.1 hypothetical protein Prum_009750 [Phytohabitans rumicis]